MNFKSVIILNLFAITSVIFVSSIATKSQIVKAEQDKESVRYYWYSRVSEEAIRSGKNKLKLDETDPEVIVRGIEILLSFQGDKSEARFCGATGFEYESPNLPCTVELAALFYASYIFYGKEWDHFATAIALVNSEEKRNDPKTIKKAFNYYRKWFEKVKEIGLEKAREKKLDPLEGSGISWD